ncbi:HAD-IA family hydrolase [Elusimicrobiota bacterium]
MSVNRIAQRKKADKSDIKVVFFDIGNVLLRFDARKVLRRFAWALRSHPFRVVKMIWTGRISDGIERGKIKGEEIYRILRELGFKGGYSRFRTIWCDQFKLERRTAGMLRRVAARRKVFLLSNTHALHYDFICERYSFPKHVHGAILSHRVRMRKPEAGIYRAALRRARVRAPQSLFIDDLRENVAAAKKLGMHAVRYQGADHLEKKLKALGVL